MEPNNIISQTIKKIKNSPSKQLLGMLLSFLFLIAILIISNNKFIQKNPDIETLYNEYSQWKPVVVGVFDNRLLGYSYVVGVIMVFAIPFLIGYILSNNKIEMTDKILFFFFTCGSILFYEFTRWNIYILPLFNSIHKAAYSDPVIELTLQYIIPFSLGYYAGSRVRQINI